jgi:hypothetical protein
MVLSFLLLLLLPRPLLRLLLRMLRPLRLPPPLPTLVRPRRREVPAPRERRRHGSALVLDKFPLLRPGCRAAAATTAEATVAMKWARTRIHPRAATAAATAASSQSLDVRMLSQMT